MDDPRPRLSVIVPCYHGGATLAAEIAAIEDVLRACEPSYEVIIVVDGDPDDALPAATALTSDRVTVLTYEPNQGKGFAVMTGMLHARGDLVGFIDAGGDIAPEAWRRLLALQEGNAADAVIGSKRHRDSEVDYPPLRRLFSLGFQALTFVLFRLGLRDTQTGIKLFTAEAVQQVAPLLTVKRFAFDVEFLAVARHLGFRRIVEAPVRVDYNFRTTINWRAILQMFWDTAAVAYRLHILRHYDRTGVDFEAARAASPAHEVTRVPSR
ncbi:MAG: glycosyltransferase [Dehalococcoidia bacterium]